VLTRVDLCLSNVILGVKLESLAAVFDGVPIVALVTFVTVKDTSIG